MSTLEEMPCKGSITIIVPAYNRSKLIKRTLDSIASQIYRPLNVILVDNNSTDNTREVMEEWANLNEAHDFDIRIMEEPKPGATSARNKALDAVETEWTMFFDSDDVMFPQHVANAMEFVRKNKEVDIVGWPIEYRLLNKKRSQKKFSDKNVFFNCIQHGTMATQRYMARTKLFRAAGKWRGDVLVWNDIELGVRLLKLNPVIRQLGKEPTVAVYDSGANSITGVDYRHNYRDRCYSLRCIENELPRDKRWIVSLKRGILAGLLKRENAMVEAEEVIKEMVQSANSKFMCLICRWACWHTSQGLPGAATIANLLLPKWLYNR